MACKTSGGDSSILAPAGWAGEGLISLVVTDRDDRRVCGGSDEVDGRPSGVFVVVFKLDGKVLGLLAREGEGAKEKALLALHTSMLTGRRSRADCCTDQTEIWPGST